MADQDPPSQDDKTEEASPERREEFRERGQVAMSREITSVAVLAASVVFLSLYVPQMRQTLERLFTRQFESAATFRVSQDNVFDYAFDVWQAVLYMTIPMFAVSLIVASGSTFAQTRLNWSWKKLAPDFSRMNPLKGIVRLVNSQALVELLKGIAKMAAVSIVAYLILKGEVARMPTLMRMSIGHTWAYWGDITEQLFWAVSALLLCVGGLDYFYNWFTLERQMKMTKREVKEEYKKRETDPMVKARMRRMQRDILNNRMLEATKTATVVVTNPTHYSVALKYELGMGAPIVVAKGVDFLALRIREVAKESDIPIIENKPLARTLFKVCEVGDEIPGDLYMAASEVIRYVFKIKGIRINREASSRA